MLVIEVTKANGQVSTATFEFSVTGKIYLSCISNNDVIMVLILEITHSLNHTLTHSLTH